MAQKNDDLAKLIAMLGKGSPSQPPPPKAVAREVSQFHDLPSPNQVVSSKGSSVDPLDHTVLSQDNGAGRLADASAPGTVLGLPRARNGNKDIKLEEPKVALKETPNQKQLFKEINADYVRHFLDKMSYDFAGLGIFNVNYSIRFRNNSLSVSSIDFLDAECKKIGGLSENRPFSENVVESLNARLAEVERKYLTPLIKAGLNILESGELLYNVEPRAPLDLNKEIDIKAPSVMMTGIELGKNSASPKIETDAAHGTPRIELGKNYNIPDKNGYVFISKEVEYHIKLENEDDLNFTMNLNRKKNDSQEIIEVAKEIFKKSERLHQFKEARLDVELLQHGSKWIFKIDNWDAHIRHKSMLEAQRRLDNSSKKNGIAIGSFALASVVLFSQQLNSVLNNYLSLNVYRLKENIPMTLPLIGHFSLPLLSYIFLTSSAIIGAGAMFIHFYINKKNNNNRGDQK